MQWKYMTNTMMMFFLLEKPNQKKKKRNLRAVLEISIFFLPNLIPNDMLSNVADDMTSSISFAMTL